jgi:uncharacterized cupin superfamily protein
MNYCRLALCATFLMGTSGMADEADVISSVKIDAAKIAGVGLSEDEQWMPPEDVLEGTHRPRGEVIYVGEQIIVEIYEDGPAVFRFPDQFMYDEYVDIQSGKLILTGADGVAHEYVAGDKLVVPKGWTGLWEMVGNYREVIVIEREAYEEEYGSVEGWYLHPEQD